MCWQEFGQSQTSQLVKQSQNSSDVFLHPLITAPRMRVPHHCVQLNCINCSKKALVAHLDCLQKYHEKPIEFLRVSTGFYGFSMGFLRVRKTRFFLKTYVLRVSTGFLRVFYGFSTGFRFKAQNVPKKSIWGIKTQLKPPKHHQPGVSISIIPLPDLEKVTAWTWKSIKNVINPVIYYIQNWGLHAMTLCSNCMGLKANQHGTPWNYTNLLRLGNEVAPVSWNDQTLAPSQVRVDFLQLGVAQVEAICRKRLIRLLGRWGMPGLWKWWSTKCCCNQVII